VRVLPQVPQTQDQDNKITLTWPESGFELTYRKRVCKKVKIVVRKEQQRTVTSGRQARQDGTGVVSAS
jgi:hypothetical protein